MSSWNFVKRERTSLSPREFMVTSVEPNLGRQSIIHIYGRTREGDSVHCQVEGFRHYFWALKPENLHSVRIDQAKDIWNRELKQPSWNGEDEDVIYNVEMEDREHLLYYKGDLEKQKYLKIVLNQPEYLSAAKKYFSGKGATGYIQLPDGQLVYNMDLMEDEGVDYKALFMLDKNVVGFGWVVLEKFETDMNHTANCTWSVCVKPDQLQGYTAEDDEKYAAIAPLRLCTFDIECKAMTRYFPSPERDPIIQISVHIKEFGSGGERMVLDTVLYTGETDPIDGCHMAEYPNEESLLRGFQQLVVASDYDISRNYNGRTFDWPYLFDRAEALHIGNQFKQMGRLKSLPAKIKKSQFNSNARGKRDFRDADISGRVDFDILHIIRCEYQLKSYKLNSVSMEFLKNTKEDVHHSMIAVLHNGSSQDRNRLARYCRKDSLLPVLLDEKLLLLVRYIEQARVCGVVLQDLVRRGQQAKVLAQILKKARLDGYVVPVKKSLNYVPDGKYEGGLVLEPDAGFHEKPIACLDFSSLYPSEGMANNMCYTTLISPTKAKEMDPGDVFQSPAGHWFVKAHVRRGLLPQLWEKLLAARKVAKKDMANANNEAEKKEWVFKAKVQNARQLALKLVANAMYGFTGVPEKAGAALTCFEVSESITACGRRDLRRVITWLKENFPNVKIRYGDSVTGDTPIIVKRNGVITIERCDELDVGGQWIHEGDKEIIYLSSDVEIWTENGFSPIKRFIRHKTDKPIIRVTTHTGVVDVTPDHSLLLENGSEISPHSVNIGTSLMHTNLPNFAVSDTVIDETDAFLMGLFMADGSCGMYNTPSTGKKYSWAINNSDYDLLVKVRDTIKFETKILDTIESSGVFKLVPHCGNIKDIVLVYRELFYNIHKEKKVPNCILSAPDEIVQAFEDGFYAGDGSRKEKEKQTIHRFSHNGKEAAMGLWILYERLGWKVSINTRSDKPNCMRMAMTKNAQRKAPNKIKKIELLHESYNDYVYDFETENHHFHVGPGKMVVHNTDSVMVEPGFDTVKETFEWMHKVGKQITEEVFGNEPPMKLQPEKVMYPTLFESKKHYRAGYYETTWEKPDKVYYRGVEVVRRDNCDLVQKCMVACSEAIFIERNIPKAIEAAKDTIQRLYLNEVNMSELIISKSLSQEVSEYKTQQAHTVLASKMFKRDASDAPVVGDRIPYVMIGETTDNIRELAEDPLYAMEHQCPINVKYYIENQLRKPLERLLVPIIGVRKTAEIFSGKHTLKRVKPPTSKKKAPRGSIMAFAVVHKTCSKCLSSYDPAKHNHPSLCANCVAQHGDSEEQKKRVRHQQLKEQYDAQMAICQQCQGSDRDPVLCMARDCGQLYRRKDAEFKYQRAIQDIEDMGAIFKKIKQ
jgi:DNA polymerase elongation subunit (family B)